MTPVLAITPGSHTLYRVWLLGREVCATNLLDKARWALAEARLALIDTITPEKASAVRLPQEAIDEREAA